MPRKNRARAISDIDYNELSGTLYVSFSDGTSYSYSGVPYWVWVEFQSAGSRGSYFNANIRGSY
jgi:hypothetical protein